jgi:hypothetical protein
MNGQGQERGQGQGQGRGRGLSVGLEGCCAVGSFPGEGFFVASEVAVGCCG